MEYNLNVRDYLLAGLKNGRVRQVLTDSGCLRGEQVSILSKVMEQNMKDMAVVEELLYQYGHLLKRTDYLGRQIFVCMVLLLRIPMRQEWETQTDQTNM